MIKTRRYVLGLGALLYASTALAGDVSKTEDVVEVSNFSELSKEISSAGSGAETVALTQDISMNNSLNWRDNFTLDGRNHKVTGSYIQFIWDAPINVNIKNMSIEGFRQSGYRKENSSGGYTTYDALGGAVLNEIRYNSYDQLVSGVISFENVSFSNNMATGDNIYAQGGAIYNTGSLTLINSSFYDNYVATTDTKDGSNGIMTGGGAIAHIASDPKSQLTIIADNGKSEFSGNKAFYAGEEESSAIFLIGGALNLVSQNNGLIKFDDKISSLSMGTMTLQQLLANAEKVTEDGNGGWFVEMKNGEEITTIHVENKDDRYEMDMGAMMGFPSEVSAEEVEQFLSNLPEGAEVIQNDGNYLIKMTLEGVIDVEMSLTKTSDDVYSLGANAVFSKFGSDINIAGDASSRVEFNEQLVNIGKIDISGTNVDVNKGTFSRSTVHDGAVLNINSGVKAEDTVVDNKGTMNVKENAEAYRTGVKSGGTLNLANGAYAEDTTVYTGGNLNAAENAKLHNMSAQKDANLNIDASSILSGNIIIDAGANLGGTYDYSNIFQDEDNDKGSLTLVGGLNDILNENSLVNNAEDKKLNLTSGVYNIGDGAQAVSGWDQLVLSDNAEVKLEGDISMRDATKKIFLETGSILNLAGHSPSNYTITGSLNSGGEISFTHDGDGADDITVIHGNYKAFNGASMTIDVDAATNTSDLLKIDGDVYGRTSVVVNPLQGDLRPSEKILFVDAPYDDLRTGAYFDVTRVIGSALNWNSLYENGKWYIGTDDIIPDGSDSGYEGETGADTGNMEDDPDYEAPAQLPDNFPDTPSDNGNSGGNSGPTVVAEAMAYMGLPSAGIEQTRDMLRNISAKVAATKVYNGPCNGFYDYLANGSYLHNAWVSPVYRNSEVDAPVDFEADISGLEAGFDVQFDYRNRTGVFASYRQGNYDFSGKGDDYRSKVGSEMDIDSYLLGMYHRYDSNRTWLMGQVFFGKQDVEISTDDGIKADTDGFEFGAGLEAGLVFNPAHNLTIEPIVGVAYTQIDYDDVSDNYGKTASYSTVNNLELEAGVKVEKVFAGDYGNSKLFVKPSIIQNIGKGDVTVTSLREVEGLEDSTLARIEIGATMNFYTQWSAYINAAYTTGSDYTSTSIFAGVNYAF